VLVDCKLPCDDERTAEFGLKICTSVELSTMAREKPGGRVAVEAGKDPRRMIGCALMGRDELNPRTKATVYKTLTAREAAFEQAQDPRRRPQEHTKNDQLPPFGNLRSDSATTNSTSLKLTVVVLASAVMSPKARSLDTLTAGKSSIAVFMCAEIGHQKAGGPLTCAFFH
jgi:hypothetical protein